MRKTITYNQSITMLLALHSIPVGQSLLRWTEFQTSVASRLASLLIEDKSESGKISSKWAVTPLEKKFVSHLTHTFI